MGFMIGGIFALSILMLIWRWALKRWVSGILLPISATLAALFTATLIAGFGLADGGQPLFWLAFTSYLIPALIVGVVVVVASIE